MQIREGRPLAPLSRHALTVDQRFWQKVAKTPSCWLWTGTLSRTGYGGFRKDGRMQKAHRVSYEMHVGPLSPDIEIDHICHNRACVRPSHLKASTRKQNTENRSGARRGSASGVRGVSPYRDGKRWVASVGHLGRNIYIGIFDTIPEAEAAARAKRNELFTNNLLDRKAS